MKFGNAAPATGQKKKKIVFSIMALGLDSTCSTSGLEIHSQIKVSPHPPVHPSVMAFGGPKTLPRRPRTLPGAQKDALKGPRNLVLKGHGRCVHFNTILGMSVERCGYGCSPETDPKLIEFRSRKRRTRKTAHPCFHPQKPIKTEDQGGEKCFQPRFSGHDFPGLIFSGQILLARISRAIETSRVPLGVQYGWLPKRHPDQDRSQYRWPPAHSGHALAQGRPRPAMARPRVGHGQPRPKASHGQARG